MDEEGEEVSGTRVYRNQAHECSGKLPLPTGKDSRFISVQPSEFSLGLGRETSGTGLFLRL